MLPPTWNVVAGDRTVDDQIAADGENAIDGVVLVIGTPIERGEPRRAADGHVVRVNGRRQQQDGKNDDEPRRNPSHEDYLLASRQRFFRFGLKTPGTSLPYSVCRTAVNPFLRLRAFA